MQTITVTLTGKNIADVIAQAKLLAESEGAVTTGTSTTKKTATTKKAAAVQDPDDFEEEVEMEADEVTDETESFDDEEEVEEPAPKKSAKKYTEKDVNAAAFAHAKENGGKKATLELLKKKFKVSSVGELKADQYAAFIKATQA